MDTHIWATEEGAAIARAVDHELGINIPTPTEIAFKAIISGMKENDISWWMERGDN